MGRTRIWLALITAFLHAKPAYIRDRFKDRLRRRLLYIDATPTRLLGYSGVVTNFVRCHFGRPIWGRNGLEATSTPRLTVNIDSVIWAQLSGQAGMRQFRRNPAVNSTGIILQRLIQALSLILFHKSINPTDYLLGLVTHSWAFTRTGVSGGSQDIARSAIFVLPYSYSAVLD